jgi:hypothetical protein
LTTEKSPADKAVDTMRKPGGYLDKNDPVQSYRRSEAARKAWDTRRKKEAQGQS